MVTGAQSEGGRESSPQMNLMQLLQKYDLDQLHLMQDALFYQ